MKIEPNLLRSQAEDFEHTITWLSTKQLERRDRIVNTGCHLLALHGLRNLRVCDLAIALNITSASFRSFFADVDALLIYILRGHAQLINKALGTVHESDPDAIAKRRTAYLGATRGPYGSLTDAHLLLVRDAPLLSETNFAAIQESHDQHAVILAGTLDPHVALTLLDAPRLDPARILLTIATLEGTDLALLIPLLNPAAAPQPESEPAEPVPPPQPSADQAWSDDQPEILEDPFQPTTAKPPAPGSSTPATPEPHPTRHNRCGTGLSYNL